MSDDIGKSVRDRIAKTSQVKAIIGPRVYADVLEQGLDKDVLPAVVVFVGSNACEEDLSTDARLFHPTVNVWTFAVDRTTANLIAKNIRDYALAADLRGEVEGMNYLDVSLTAGPTEAVDAPPSGGNVWRRVTQQSFTIWATPI
jgi:hypothetical protein